jgi:hypothetical protein
MTSLGRLADVPEVTLDDIVGPRHRLRPPPSTRSCVPPRAARLVILDPGG